MISGQSPLMPIAAITTRMPISCSAMYGIVASRPVSAVVKPRVELP